MNRVRFIVSGARYVSALEDEFRSRFDTLEAENHELQMRALSVEGELTKLKETSRAHKVRLEDLDRRIGDLGDLSEATRDAVADLLTEVAEVIAQELNEVNPL